MYVSRHINPINCNLLGSIMRVLNSLSRKLLSESGPYTSWLETLVLTILSRSFLAFLIIPKI